MDETENTESVNVQPSAPADDIPAAPADADSPVGLMPGTSVRIGGQPGVRVQHFTGGVTQVKRVTAIDAVPVAPPDHKPVPIAVLAQVRDLLYGDQPLAAAEALRTVRDLLDPWL